MDTVLLKEDTFSAFVSSFLGKWLCSDEPGSAQGSVLISLLPNSCSQGINARFLILQTVYSCSFREVHRVHFCHEQYRSTRQIS